jgi:hypothetical protein
MWIVASKRWCESRGHAEFKRGYPTVRKAYEALPNGGACIV